MKSYYFTIVLHGLGESIEDAWQDACEAFMDDPGSYNEDRTEIYDADEPEEEK